MARHFDIKTGKYKIILETPEEVLDYLIEHKGNCYELECLGCKRDDIEMVGCPLSFHREVLNRQGEVQAIHHLCSSSHSPEPFYSEKVTPEKVLHRALEIKQSKKKLEWLEKLQ